MKDATESFWSENKTGILVAAIVLVVGTAYYFGADLDEEMGGAATVDPVIFAQMELKTGVLDGKYLKLFAQAQNNAMAMLETSAGNPIPERGSMVVGSDEAAMMIEEKLFERPGDKLAGFFGVDTDIEGVLAPTGTFVDMAHFLGPEQFATIAAEQNAFVKLSPEGAPKLFYTLGVGETFPVPLAFAEGKFDDYETHDLVGTTYVPVIVGAKEAQMMIEEKLFQKPGDTIKGFFGNDIVIVGVLEETGTPLDMMHITPLTARELK